MGYETSSQIIETPTKMNFGDKKIVDVGCGDRFTVVLANNNSEKLPYIYPKEKFNQQNIKNIKERKNIIMNILNVKKQMKDDQYEENSMFEENFINEKEIEKKEFDTRERKKKHKSLHLNRNYLETSKNLLNEINEIKRNNNSKLNQNLESNNFLDGKSDYDKILTNSTFFIGNFNSFYNFKEKF